MNVHQVKRTIDEGQSLDIRYKWHNRDAVAARPFARPSGGPERDVRRNHPQSSPGEELGVHPGASTDGER